MTNPSFIFVVGGPCGCGKSSVGAALGNLLSVPFIEGDEIHPPENVLKMSEGIPLTDEDRWGWLKQIAIQSFSKLTPLDYNGKKADYSVVGCSSLKKVYRDLIVSEVAARNRDTKVIFIFINISIEDSRRRVAARKNHYMKPNMVDSQFQILETPKGDEVLVDSSGAYSGKGNSIVIDPTDKGREEIVVEVVKDLTLANIL